MNRAIQSFGDLQSLFISFLRSKPGSLSSPEPRRQASEPIHHLRREGSFPIPHSVETAAVRSGWFRDALRTREINLEGGASAEDAIGPDIAAALLYNPIHGRQRPRPVPFPNSFVRKKGFKESSLRLGCPHAYARVAHRKHHVRPRVHGSMPPRISFIQLYVGGFNRQLPAPGHGIARI